MKRGRGGESPSDSFYEEEEEREKEDRITVRQDKLVISCRLKSGAGKAEPAA